MLIHSHPDQVHQTATTYWFCKYYLGYRAPSLPCPDTCTFIKLYRPSVLWYIIPDLTAVGNKTGSSVSKSLVRRVNLHNLHKFFKRNPIYRIHTLEESQGIVDLEYILGNVCIAFFGRNITYSNKLFLFMISSWITFTYLYNKTYPF